MVSLQFILFHTLPFSPPSMYPSIMASHGYGSVDLRWCGRGDGITRPNAKVVLAEGWQGQRDHDVVDLHMRKLMETVDATMNWR
ncbi:hypothetical protein SESBI_46773 [Sesbania bispinosa]|nr:hypothetical protein SESBI_46773 [Sesbania bispinosa]